MRLAARMLLAAAAFEGEQRRPEAGPVWAPARPYVAVSLCPPSMRMIYVRLLSSITMKRVVHR
jgi:hypothetical protein